MSGNVLARLTALGVMTIQEFKAYVASKKAEGWALVPDHYNGGGFSGGTLE